MTLLRSFFAQGDVPLPARLFLQLLRRIRTGHLVLVTPDGGQCVFSDPLMQPAAHLLHIHDWRACHAILRAGDIGFAEAYRNQWLDTPDAAPVLRLAIRNEATMRRTVTGGLIAQCWYNLRHRLRPNMRRSSRRNIHAHYDIGNDFYALWLDPSWTYSSAWFDGDATLSLKAAQHCKYRRLIDTLGLRVLEIGCGWGGFVCHAARHSRAWRNDLAGATCVRGGADRAGTTRRARAGRVARLPRPERTIQRRNILHAAPLSRAAR